jgi:hypothetical protein
MAIFSYILYKNYLIYLHMKESIDGVILVLSCQKHMNTRLKELNLNPNGYGKWKVVYVIADLFMDRHYELRDKHYMWIKCEDSYIHLMKKLALSLKYVFELYDIKEGVLRCCDDSTFNEDRLMSFLEGKKSNYHGQNIFMPHGSIYVGDVHKTCVDKWMYDYYRNHPEDLENPQHNLLNVDISKYLKRSHVTGALGGIFYLSKLACQIIIDHMEGLSYDIFSYDESTKSYPYTIEDRAVAFIMFYNKIPLKNSLEFYSDHHYNPNVICTHTNKYK